MLAIEPFPLRTSRVVGRDEDGQTIVTRPAESPSHADAAPPVGPAPVESRSGGAWPAFWLSLATMCLMTGVRDVLVENEADVLVAARHFVDPSWIPGDWYLGLDIGYRAVFNVVAGTLARAFGLVPAALVGRFLGAVCVAAAFAQLFARLRVHLALVVPIVFLCLRYRSVVAEEWIVGSFETKTFAYAAALLAMAAAMRGRLFVAAALSGIAVDFHVLVGAYAAVTLCVASAFDLRRVAGRARRVGPAALVFLAVALPGLFAIVRALADGAGVDVRAAGEIYVLLRVPQHAYPPHWHAGFWIVRAALLVAVLAVGLLRGRRPQTRFLARYALLSASFALVGGMVLWAGRIDLLKFYWFRFPDVVLPLGGIVVAGALVSERVPRFGGERWRAAATAVSCVALLPLVPAFVRGASNVLTSTREAPCFLRALPEDLRATLLWVRDSTPTTDSVLLDPFLVPSYLATERAQFVSFKCSPQSDRDVLEWGRRFAILADVDDVRASGRAAFERVRLAAYRLPEPVVARVAREFGTELYVAERDHLLPYPVEFARGRYCVYRLSRPRRTTGG